jgi:hypothetical protein
MARLARELACEEPVAAGALPHSQAR